MDSLADKNWLVAGLGNPGLQYERTRHNLGFMLVDRLAREYQTSIKREECRALIGRADIGGQIAELVKPQTFMNLSGESIKCLLNKSDRSIKKMIVITDDLALPVGTIRIRPQGTHGGQNGLKSIINCLGTNEFIRLRIGIQPPHPLGNISNFVLENFSKTETAEIETVLDKCAEAIRAVIVDGVEKAMAQYN